MALEREQRVVPAMVEFADTLVTGFDLVDFLHRLTERCAELLDASAAGLMLVDPNGKLRVMAASDERANLLELFELQNQEGPCLDSFRTGQAVVNEPIDESSRWPAFASEARAAGFRSVHALPLRLRKVTMGALNLFQTYPGQLDKADIRVGQALADIATIGIFQERALSEARTVASQLQSALNSRVVIEQAKGMLSERAGVDMDEAFRLIRAYSRRNNLHLSDVTRRFIDGTLPTESLTDRPG